jgi:hypothetical protein
LHSTAIREVASPTSYDVALPEAGLGWEKVGPLFERYSVRVTGQVDEHWTETYRRICSQSPNLSRFRLDAASGAVSFTCRSTDGPVEVMRVLKILGELLERVNRDASLPPTDLEASAPQREGPRPRPFSAFRGIGATRSR